MPVERCPICGGPIEEKLTDFHHVYRGIPIRISEVPFQVCTECGEELVDSRFGKIIEESIDQYRQFRDFDYNDLLTCEEAAALLTVSYQAVLAMLSDGKLPGTKIGREWRISYGLLMEYIQSMSAHNLTQPEKEIFETYCKFRQQK